MAQQITATGVRRIDEAASIIDIQGEITARSEQQLMEAYAAASGARTRVVILNFERLEYMNSGGIGLLVTLLVRANRQKQHLSAYGLNEHYRQIFELTRLDEAIAINQDEASALAATKAR
ncbi:MAG: STAS domain-containing protein [Chloroflexi bacterium]|nr:MAG: STAS domain-containing protein [Chloroflexota bacterium]